MADNIEDSNKFSKILSNSDKKYRIAGMFKDWFLDYASYVILDRAVPHLEDGLKPVQRRILHSLKLMDDGRYNKVANIIGHTMQFHPHGDASIGNALVQLGQKELLIDTQGNWGNILTGDSAAAPRYIEARLTKFALEVVFNDKTTEWIPSYDGRNREPVSLPVKFPLLLAQGAEGIGVGLAVKILPHNFNELIDAAIDYLHARPFVLYPDFVTGGLMDCSRYANGLRGGRVRVRARIVKLDKKTLAVTEIPFGTNTASIIASIIAANDTGKIKIRKVDDNTARNAEILVHLAADVSPDKTIDALYAFTKCEISIATDSCVIYNRHPVTMPVEDLLRHSVDRTKELLKRELEIKLGELEEDWHYSSLEKIFFEERIYRRLENDSARNWKEQLAEVLEALSAYQDRLRRPVTADDVSRLVEKPVRKISKFDIKKATEHIRDIEAQREETENNLLHLIDYTIAYYSSLKKKYGADRQRRTEICNFENIKATTVVQANAKLYVNYAEGFIGTDLKKDENARYLCDCSDIDEVIVFLRSGKYMVIKVSNKAFVGKDIIHADVFRRDDARTIYNVVYRNGKSGYYYVKRFAVVSILRDKEYDLTQGEPDSRVCWFTANPNGEAESIKIFLKLHTKLRKLFMEYSFTQLAIRGRSTRGNLLTKHPVQRIALKEKGVATLGGQKIWYDADIQRLNTDARGQYTGSFLEGEHILVINNDGTFYTTNFDLSNRYQGEVLRLEKLDLQKVYTILYFDGESQYFYVKRCCFEVSDNQAQSFISPAPGSYFIALTDRPNAEFSIVFGGKNRNRPEETVDAADFIGRKSFRAKGKRVSNFEVEKVCFTEVPDLQAPEDLDADTPFVPDFGYGEETREAAGEKESVPDREAARENREAAKENKDADEVDAIQMTLL